MVFIFFCVGIALGTYIVKYMRASDASDLTSYFSTFAQSIVKEPVNNKVLLLNVLKKNLIKIVIGMGIVDSGINLLLISIGYRTNGTAPIFSDNSTLFFDPIPQALTLTSIVIGACVTALALSIVIKIKEHYGSIESDDIRRIRG